MMEEIGNYPMNAQNIVEGNQKEQFDGASGVQLEWISNFLAEYPEAALNVHKYLQRNYASQQ